jgi:tetratricopeptide (TPR) repeat protein
MRNRNTYIACGRIILMLILLLFSPYPQSYADSGSNPDLEPFLIIDADKQYELADHYFTNQDFSRAITEYQRFIYFFPQNERTELAMFKIGLAHFKSRYFNKAIQTFQELIDQYGETELGIKSYFMISEGYAASNLFDAAIANLNNLATLSDDADIRDEAYYRIGWLYIETASWEDADRYFSKISPLNRDKYRIQSLSADLLNEKFIPEKNPGVAGVLSVVPGAGYVYTERYQDALIAFLLNGVLFYAAYESFDEDLNALGGILTVVGLGFYAGNIYGAVSSAHKYNRTQTVRFIEELKQNHKLNLSSGVGRKGFHLTVKLPF